MTPQEFIAWRKRMELTQGEAAERLGVSRRAIVKREAGETPINTETEYATRWLEAVRDGLVTTLMPVYLPMPEETGQA